MRLLGPLTSALTFLTIFRTAVVVQGADDAAGVAFFEAKIRPVLTTRCYQCHSVEAQAKKTWKGGLLLDSREGSRVGGTNGPAVVPGDVEKSLLIKALRHEDFEMPPSGKLPAAVIADFERWIADGAVDPRDGKAPLDHVIDLEAGRRFWSFQPPQKSPTPAVKDSAWPRGEIDRFVLAKLEADKLRPVADADPHALVRRVYFDLIGLPPTPEEVAEFVRSDSAAAYEQLVDKLLASPRFGERWGRHWLDVARYAESTGQTPVGIYRYAWRYRDYVIDAFNHDKPYDQFVREQVAGDLLDSATQEQRNERLIATGFLAIGPRNLAESNPLQYVMENVNEQIETIGQAFMGLSVGCARCHDHKFDPIPAADYYALAGILQSSDLLIGLAAPRGYFGKPSELAVLKLSESDPQFVAYQAFLQKETTLVTQLEKSLAELEKIEPQVAAAVARVGGASKLSTKNLRPLLASRGSKLGEMKLSSEAEKMRAELVVNGRAAFKELKSVQQRLSQAADGSQERRDLEKQQADLNARLDKIKNDYSELQKMPAKPPMMMAKQTPATAEKNEDATVATAELLKANITEVVGELDVLRRENPTPAAMGVRQSERLQDSPLYQRGNIESPGKTVPRGFLQVVRVADPPVVPPDACGRKELADWLTRPDHPLTARVMVNRIWLHLFGAGLVPTPNDFGATGEPPTHPELLDYLAVRFQEEGWSIKRLIRAIMLSRAYRLSAAHDAKNLAGDPENRRLWRANRRRLEVEAIRDAVLAIGGELELDRPTVSPLAGVPADLIERKLRQEGPVVDPALYVTNRRTVYIPIIREEEPRLLALFDLPNTSASAGSRSATSVATQALFMMNNPFVARQARNAAAKLLQPERLSVRERVDLAYRTILNRPADEQERAEATAYVEKFRDGEDSLEVWTNFCQVLFASAEFRYLN